MSSFGNFSNLRSGTLSYAARQQATQQQGTSPEQPQVAPAPTSQTGTAQAQQGLPPTGIQQQMASLNALYGQAGAARGGYDVRQQQFGQAQAAGGGVLPEDAFGAVGAGGMGSSSLDQMARNLAQSYGLPIGRGRLVDEGGNFLMTPQQIADASGGKLTLGEAASQMNYISQAITQKHNEDQQKKGLAALQTGLGQVQSRGRGSLASMMSGYYQDIADMYANQTRTVRDFSYEIQKEKMDIEMEMQRRQEKMQKKAGRAAFFTGIGLTITGIATGQTALIAQGAGATVGGAATSGWFAIIIGAALALTMIPRAAIGVEI